ncbi:MAG: acetylxylan esterase [Planctomycetia bacterium]|nr:acetylxylan esterase [Planctomycetia bacterium]
MPGRMKRIVPALCVWIVLHVCLASAAEDLNCLSDSERTASKLYARLQSQALTMLDGRTAVFEGLKSPENIREYQAKLRTFFTKQLGGFPERTPLNARTVRTLKAKGYRVENVLYESRPHHTVAANFYLPDGPGPFPAVLVSSGHSRTGKTADYNQRFGIAMALNGMAAICFDPIGQGERSQILNENGAPQFPGTVTEHFLVGVGSILVGRNTASYRAWDAMRTIDYLETRPEIDPKRIGMTGCSGGGTMTSYVMALDDRIACAAPACYLSTMRKLIETIGPQDAEQNIFGQISFGLDQPDYVLMRAPRPTLISSTTGDFFDIRGSWDNYRQAKRIYGRLGFPERVDLVEIEGVHGVQPQNLATIVYWMRRWLLDKDDVVPAATFTTHPENDLLCTEHGQVLRLPGERSVFDLNAEYESELAVRRQAQWKAGSLEAMRGKVREVAAVRPLDQITPPTMKDIGRVQREKYHIDKLVLNVPTGAVLSGLTFHPKIPKDDAYLYLHDSGKSGDSEAGGAIEQLVEKGYAVVSIDLSGQGETASGKREPLLGDWKNFYLAYLMGRSLTSVRTEDAIAAAHFVAYYQKEKTSPRRVHVIGVGHAGIAALHAAALQPELFASVTLRNSPHDWSSTVKQSAPLGILEGSIHGVLQLYDLPDLVRLIGEDKVRIEK